MMKMTSSVGFILLAGGSSTRMGSSIKKELHPLADGQNALQKITQQLLQVTAINHLHVVYHKDYYQQTLDAVSAFDKGLSSSVGADNRQASVYQALLALEPLALDYILIHDGARAFVTSNLIQLLIEQLANHAVVLPVIPVTDSLKRIDSAGNVVEQCDRRQYALAQTPQAFHFNALLQAHHALKAADFSDDVALHYAHHQVMAKTIAGDPNNKKLTYLGDLDA